MEGHLLLFTAGLGLLLGAAALLVHGAGLLAARLGVPPVLIGMTVVAFGTSTPELAVSLLAASDRPGIAFGNVVGSNIANIGLLLGVTALAKPLVVHASIVTREIPMLLLASAVAFVLLVDGYAARADGIVLLLLFCVFLYYTLGDALRRREDPFLAEAQAAAPAPRPLLSCSLMVGGGLAGVVWGGTLVVDSAVDAARSFGISEAVIGLTMVAVGTSLPELATSIVAARRGESDLAVGNIVGSNLFNLLFILGLAGTTHPFALPARGLVDLGVMGAFALVLLPLAVSHGRRLERWEGALLLLGYAGYIVWLAAA